MQTLEKAIKKVLSVQKLKLPDRPRVEDIKFSQIVDSIGDAALRVMVILDESTTDEEREWTSLAPIAAAIHNALTEAEIDLWPYIRFRKLSEQSMAMAEQ